MLPKFGGLPALGAFNDNGQLSHLNPHHEDLPVLDDDDPLFSNINANFDLLDYLFNEEQHSLEPIPMLSDDIQNSEYDLIYDPVEFLENLKKEGDGNLFDTSSKSGRSVEPFNRSSHLNHLEQTLIEYSADPFSQCMEDLYDLENENRNCISPSSISDTTYDSDSNSSIQSNTFQKSSLQFDLNDCFLSEIQDFSNDYNTSKLPSKKILPYKTKLSVDKRARKKQQNRESALRYREKKRKENSSIDVELKRLEEHNTLLLSKVKEAKNEIAYLKNFLSDIICVNS